MTTTTYDYIKKLEQAGFTPAQVETLALPMTEMVVRPELKQVEKDLSDKIEKAETRLEKRMDERFDLVDKRFAVIEQFMTERFAVVEKRLDSLSSLIKWLIATVVALIPSLGAYTSWFLHIAGH